MLENIVFAVPVTYQVHISQELFVDYVFDTNANTVSIVRKGTDSGSFTLCR